MSIVKGMPDTEYHARPELSSTEVRMLLDSPAKYRWRKDNPPLIDPSDKFDVGTAVHTMVLGTGAPVDVLDFPDYRTKAAQTERDAVRATGRVPILRGKYDEITVMAEAVLAHPGARQLFNQPADPEVSVFATVEGVECRARFDFLPTEFTLGAPSRVAVDLKTSRDASPEGFARSVADFGYDVQHAWYLDVLRAETGEDAEMVFVAVEKEPPYLVAVHQLPAMWAAMGQTKARVGRRRFAECVESGVWPGYGDQVHLLSPPTWAVYQHEERYGDE